MDTPGPGYYDVGEILEYVKYPTSPAAVLLGKYVDKPLPPLPGPGQYEYADILERLKYDMSPSALVLGKAKEKPIEFGPGPGSYDYDLTKIKYDRTPSTILSRPVIDDSKKGRSKTPVPRSLTAMLSNPSLAISVASSAPSSPAPYSPASSLLSSINAPFFYKPLSNVSSMTVDLGAISRPKTPLGHRSRSRQRDDTNPVAKNDTKTDDGKGKPMHRRPRSLDSSPTNKEEEAKRKEREKREKKEREKKEKDKRDKEKKEQEQKKALEKKEKEKKRTKKLNPHTPHMRQIHHTHLIHLIYNRNR